jgi:stage V sporulation protein K
MAIFLVGPDNKTLFKKRSTWEFFPALEAAADGDIIELQENFWPLYEQDKKSVTIEKNITFQGHVQKNDDGQIFTNLFDGIFVTNGATVTLKDICISRDNASTNGLNVKKGSTVIADNVLIENTASDGKVYPIVYIEGNSEVRFNQVTVKPSLIASDNHQLYVKDSKLELTNTSIAAKIYADHATIHCENVGVEYSKGSTLFSKEDSQITAKNSTFSGGFTSKETVYPCVYCKHSEITLDSCFVVQPDYFGALYTENTKVHLIKGKIDAAQFSTSSVSIEHTIFMGSMAASDSAIHAGNFFIAGRDNNRINLFVTNKSSLKAENINFGRFSSPNIKIEKNVDFEVDHLNAFQYDVESEKFVVDENNYFITLNKELPIEYFGEMTALERLNGMIGLQSIKADIKEFIAITEMNKTREEKGLGSANLTLHSLFLGNPGTGKTTVARIVGEVLSEKGIIKENKLIETSRSDLVGQYVGATALKTREVLESALGGVLFIDEAYTLANGSANDFGLEAVNEILKFMEDHRDNIVIIFAGYTDEMKKFLELNEGLKSRIPNVFTFEDYTPDELFQIGLNELHGQNYEVDETDYRDLIHHNFELSNDFSNGRWVRNLNERIIRKLAVRLYDQKNADMSKITTEDLLAVKL